MELLRRLLKRLGEHRPLLYNERLLALLRGEKLALRADDIAEIELLERGKGSLGEFVTLENQLKAVGAVVHGAEIHFAHTTNHKKASSYTSLFTLFKFSANLDKVVMIIFAAVRLIAHFGKGLHACEPLLAIFIRFHSPTLYHIFLIKKKTPSRLKSSRWS